MEILGYSERGLVTSLFYEIAQKEDSFSTLTKLLNLAVFPFNAFESGEILGAEIFIEHSFSDFGDADALLLLTCEAGQISMFIEAKVKTYQRRSWHIEREWEKFIQGTKSRLGSSNLFTQLYHKVRMVENLRAGGLETLQHGVPFPPCSTKQLRKIGRNKVVLSAVKRLEQFLDASYYLAILPEEPENLARFYQDTLLTSAPSAFEGWDVRRHGYLSWMDVEIFCLKLGLMNTFKIFRHNRGGIYRSRTGY
jgi:hypothetical protein